MTSEAPAVSMLREAWFWSGIMSDHARFIHDHLAPGQEQALRWATDYRQALQALNEDIRQVAQAAGLAGPAGAEVPLARPDMSPRLEPQARPLVSRLVDGLRSLRGFKEHLLQSQLECRVKLGLPPSLIAHMIIEAEEGYRTLAQGPESPVAAPAAAALHHHLVWLPDAAGHAAIIHSKLDPAEPQLQRTALSFKQVFDGMHITALELRSMLRVAPRMVGALRRLNQDALAQMAAFRSFLSELREHLAGCQVLGTLMPELADHMLREELYYTEKLLALGALPTGSGT